ncbi:MAG: glycerol kinase GlpK [Alphaproteobacteria bacterium]|uniref:glycerol kinase GlpK n=1 Tax=Brevundimonas sp. TaxID=1871086 RepID=UPI001D41919A|nr:glycerol kinase GlpK [Alphaproteobacteria bacterium]MBU2166109.1 glycerol kinase GlpK [Alphaproteobacteria bacterium]MBU2231934.1 glycerol kinase GlpK [Alphaproteobacteria bacterium]MBU2347925.1 glycerol kinase GlpK [Alphaproteobacteria bacterium]MBU2400427.1 glycerol kinase GlpK [Alphaproteobacteria bacterium]
MERNRLSLILAIDQGTTSTRAIAFEVRDGGLHPVAVSQIELAQHFPQSGWVEHDASEIWSAVLQTCREVVQKAGGVDRFAAVGLTNQRETAVMWDAGTGAPLHRAIVWQDRRTAPVTARLTAEGQEPAVQAATGLILDPYFSATKFAWLLDSVPGARDRAIRGEVKLGTIDAWLIWKLTGGRIHATDASNAARTALMDLKTVEWRDDLCALFAVPRAALPAIVPCAGVIGETEPGLFGRALPLAGSAGDQQAALVGHGALHPGDAKITYGTGAFLVANVGPKPVASTRRLLGTLGYQAAGQTAYALEGSIFSAGSAIQWLRDGVKLISESRQSEALAQGLADNGGVYMVPGFTGLGAPWWEPEARGAVVGLTRDSGPAHFVRAALEALAYQTRDLLDALAQDGAPPLKTLKVDGGVTANSFAMQFVADICEVEVERPAFQEMTALGAARLAALGVGLLPDLQARTTEAPARWTPRMKPAERDRLLSGWRRAVKAAIIAAPDRA